MGRGHRSRLPLQALLAVAFAPSSGARSMRRGAASGSLPLLARCQQSHPAGGRVGGQRAAHGRAAASARCLLLERSSQAASAEIRSPTRATSWSNCSRPERCRGDRAVRRSHVVEAQPQRDFWLSAGSLAGGICGDSKPTRAASSSHRRHSPQCGGERAGRRSRVVEAQPQRDFWLSEGSLSGAVRRASKPQQSYVVEPSESPTVAARRPSGPAEPRR